MKIAIYAGTKGLLHLNDHIRAIKAAGHDPIIVSSDVLAPLSESFDMALTYIDNFFVATQNFNKRKGMKTLSFDPAEKRVYSDLVKGTDFQTLRHYESLTDIPSDLEKNPLFLKVSKSVHSWFDQRVIRNQYELKEAIDHIGGEATFNRMIKTIWLLQDYYRATEGIMYHLLNDGRETVCYGKSIFERHLCTPSQLNVVNRTAYGIQPCQLSTILDAPGLYCVDTVVVDDVEYLLDINPRLGANSGQILLTVNPDFLVTYYDNLLNGKQQEYDFSTNFVEYTTNIPKDLTGYTHIGNHIRNVWLKNS